MPIARVQSSSFQFQNGGTSLNSVFGSSVTTGNCIVACAGMLDNSFSVTSITDTSGNLYSFVSSTHATMASAHVGWCEFWIAKNVTGGFTTITANYSNGTSRNFIGAIEYSGVSTTSPTGIVGTLNNQGAGNPTSPSLIISASTSALVAFCVTGDDPPTSVDAPWSFIDVGNLWGAADYIPGSSGTFQATFNPPEGITWGSSGVELLASTPLTLNLNDSISSNDSTTNEDDKTLTDSITSSDLLGLARAENVSDNLTLTDSFSLQSSFIAPNPIPSVESLTNNLIPAEVKTFWEFQE